MARNDEDMDTAGLGPCPDDHTAQSKVGEYLLSKEAWIWVKGKIVGRSDNVAMVLLNAPLATSYAPH